MNLDSVLRKGLGKPRSTSGAEDALDALLLAQSVAGDTSGATGTEGASPLDVLRQRFKNDLAPAFEELKVKYQSRGVGLSLSVDDFLQGGRGVRLVIEFGGAGLRLDGTVMANTVAFQQTSYSQQDPGGIAASGPSLRTRDLNADTFRSFVCERIGSLVESVVGRKK